MALVNSAAVIVGLNVSFQISVFSQFMPRRGVTGLYVSSIFSFLRNLHTVLHSGFNNLHSHPQCREGSFFFILSQAFIICRLFGDGHSDHCGGDTSLYFRFAFT